MLFDPILVGNTGGGSLICFHIRHPFSNNCLDILPPRNGEILTIAHILNQIQYHPWHWYIYLLIYHHLDKYTTHNGWYGNRWLRRTSPVGLKGFHFLMLRPTSIPVTHQSRQSHGAALGGDAVLGRHAGALRRWGGKNRPRTVIWWHPV